MFSVEARQNQMKPRNFSPIVLKLTLISQVPLYSIGIQEYPVLIQCSTYKFLNSPPKFKLAPVDLKPAQVNFRIVRMNFLASVYEI